MKKFIFCAVGALLLSGAAAFYFVSKAREARLPIRAVFVKDTEDVTRHIEIQFFRGKKKLASYRAEAPCSFKFMTAEADYQGVYNRFLTADHSYQEIPDISPFLTDMTGCGEKRHLLIGKYHGGNYHAWDGILVDVKNNFAVFQPLSVGEICFFEKKNPDLIFDYPQLLWSAPQQADVHISVKIKLRPNAEPEIMPLAYTPYVPLEKFQDALKSAKDTDTRERLFAMLFAHLVNHGKLKSLIFYAKETGFTNKEIVTYNNTFRKIFREMKYHREIEKFNGY